MVTLKQLSEKIGVTRPSIGRIIKREGVATETKYDPATRKQTKFVSDADAEKLYEKYINKEK